MEVGTPHELGDVGGGRRRVVPILGGAVQGPRLSAVVLPGGANWQTIYPGGRTEVLAATRCARRMGRTSAWSTAACATGRTT